MVRVILLILAAFAILSNLLAASPLPDEGHGPTNPTYDDLVRQYCGDPAFHCIFMSRGEPSRLTLDTIDAKGLTLAQAYKEHVYLWIISDAAGGQVRAECAGSNGTQSIVKFSLSNYYGSQAETVKGTINGIFKSKPGVRLEAGPIHSEVYGDGLSLYCPVKHV